MLTMGGDRKAQCKQDLGLDRFLRGILSICVDVKCYLKYARLISLSAFPHLGPPVLMSVAVY